MSHPNINFMYINIPKNASSWTKKNLINLGWEFYNYHTDNLYEKHALIVLRDPLERWLSGIAEYLYLYHKNLDTAHLSNYFFDLLFDKIAFDDHTEKQVLFVDKLNLDKCTFFKCDSNYQNLLSLFFNNNITTVQFSKEHEHVSDLDPLRKKFKKIFSQMLNENSKYLKNLKQYFDNDYKFIQSRNFYAG